MSCTFKAKKEEEEQGKVGKRTIELPTPRVEMKPSTGSEKSRSKVGRETAKTKESRDAHLMLALPPSKSKAPVLGTFMRHRGVNLPLSSCQKRGEEYNNSVVFHHDSITLVAAGA